MRVATYNIHAGVDGYGRATRVLDSVADIKPDLLFAQEVWRGEREDQFEALKDRLGLEGTWVALGHGQRSTEAKGGRGWQSPLALVRGESGLFFEERRTLTSHQRARRERAGTLERGDWGLALLTNRTIVSTEVLELDQLGRDRVSRRAILARLADGPVEFVAVAVHGAHISHGSLGQYAALRRRLDQLAHDVPVVVAGDFNCWRPLLRTVLPGWRAAARARTWPAWRPHSQIDHILYRGPWRARDGRAVAGPSDHRALVADLAVGT